QPTDVAAFEAYYLGTHRPLALQIPGLQEILGGPVLGTLEGGQAETHRIAVVRFAGRAELEAALASPEGQAAFADVANFATGGVTAFFVRLESVAGAAGAGTPTP
ncbi:MAG: EthD family reductase, partial [Chloroflexota bacterium]|nr:EthD family reductase [Chloroflexota bacterium]